MPSVETPSVAAVVLAAGSSTRMGRNKLLLDLGGETVVRRAVQAAVEARLAPVIVVLGHEAERVRAELGGLPCVPVVNPDHVRGVGTSLQAGVRRAAAEAGAGAMILILADMPFVTAAMLTTLVERYRATGAPLVVSRYGEVQAPPNLFDRSLFSELLSTDDERCAKRVVRGHENEAVVVPWPVEDLRDIDVAEDYERVRAHLAAR
jgi:molybdenum cofactor cytidylyltransferase